MKRKDSTTKDHIVSVAADMISASGSAEFRILDVAKAANVGVPTVYYHFESRNRLVAEAQLQNYTTIAQPIYDLLERIEHSIQEHDQVLFWQLLEQHARMLWRAGHPETGFGVISILTDIWSDPTVKSSFHALLEEQFERWIVALEGSRSLEWTPGGLDPKTLIVMLWSTSIGQAITLDLKKVVVSDEEFRDFYMKVIKG